MRCKNMGFIVKVFLVICLTVAISISNINIYCLPDNDECADQITQQEFQKELCDLQEIYGEEFYNDINRTSESPPTSPTVNPHKILFLQLENFKSFSSLKTKEIDQILTEYFNLYPPTWISHIKNITFESQDKRPACIKNPENRWWIEGAIEYYPHTHSWIIYIYPIVLKESLESNPSILCETFSHELSHLNDWRGGINMTPKQKLEFFKKTAYRLNSPDHYSKEDNYLNNLNLDTPQQTAYRKVMEYWATISSVYLSGKSKDKNLPFADIELAKSIIEYTDPQFTNIAQNAKVQRSLANKIFY